MRVAVCVCVCARAHARVCVCACACVHLYVCYHASCCNVSGLLTIFVCSKTGMYTHTDWCKVYTPPSHQYVVVGSATSPRLGLDSLQACRGFCTIVLHYYSIVLYNHNYKYASLHNMYIPYRKLHMQLELSKECSLVARRTLLHQQLPNQNSYIVNNFLV